MLTSLEKYLSGSGHLCGEGQDKTQRASLHFHRMVMLGLVLDTLTLEVCCGKLTDKPLKGVEALRVPARELDDVPACPSPQLVPLHARHTRIHQRTTRAASNSHAAAFCSVSATHRLSTGEGVSAGIPFGEGDLTGTSFGVCTFAGTSFGEGVSAGIPFDETKSVVNASGEARETLLQ